MCLYAVHQCLCEVSEGVIQTYAFAVIFHSIKRHCSKKCITTVAVAHHYVVQRRLLKPVNSSCDLSTLVTARRR